MNNQSPLKLAFFKKIFERVEIAREESDTDYFLTLLYAGEMLTKIVVLGLASGIQNDSNRSRYTQLYSLVRADGIGDWVKSLEEVLVGPTSHQAVLETKKLSKDLVQKLPRSSWQYEALGLVHSCLVDIGEPMEDLPTKAQAKNWFHYFARLRNKTRGHGAHKAQILAQVTDKLERSIKLIISNFSLFDCEWAFLSQNLSGKYRVSSISNNTSSFNYLRSNFGKNEHHQTGVYIYLSRPVRVELLESDIELMDFFLPNGNFSGKRFEIISYLTGIKDTRENVEYLYPAGKLPQSETEGFKELNIVGNCFTNLPKYESIYIHRSSLQKQLLQVLTDSRHPVITLVGRGGIGKTSLALHVLRQLCQRDDFQTVLWFSARDIDLLEEGAKFVKPHVIKIDDLASEFVSLLDTSKQIKKDAQRLYMQEHLTKSDIGPMLVVLDNFETVENPEEMFAWLDTYVRLPNKILITSRFRDFKADYPIIVGGLTRDEFDALYHRISNDLAIVDILDDVFKEELFYETGGHPYVTKIILGEVAKGGKMIDLKRVVTENDDLLTALFERTFSIISNAAKRLFLTLCSWRSIVPSVGIEAVLQARASEKFEVDEAVEELYSFSFIDKIKSKADNLDFIFVPLSAFLFGKKKLKISPLKSLIDQDLQLLMLFGVGRTAHIGDGVRSRIDHFFRQAANKVNTSPLFKFENIESILRNICQKDHYSWLSMALFYEENSMLFKTIECYYNYLEIEQDDYKKISVWIKLAGIYSAQGASFEEANCILQMCELNSTPFSFVSSSTNRINQLVSIRDFQSDEERMAILHKMIDIFLGKSVGMNLEHDDSSKLAWLYINSGNIKEAKKIVKDVLTKDPSHHHCLKINKKLNVMITTI